MNKPNVIHHLAMRRSLAVAVCGADHDDEGLSLDPQRVTCTVCRRICGLKEES